MTITGGPVFWILLALAIAAVIVFFERLLELRRAHIDWQDFLEGVINVLEQGNRDEALSICEDSPVPVANVTAAAIRHQGDAHSLKEAVDAQSRIEISRLDRRLGSLAVIGQIAPLLGLLGTIFGFIRTIHLINGEELVARCDLVNAASESLIVAAIGLAVAIPVAVMYSSLKIRLERLVSELQAASTKITGYLNSRREAK